MSENNRRAKRKPCSLPTTVSMHTLIEQFNQKLQWYVYATPEDRDEILLTAGFYLADLLLLIAALLQPAAVREEASKDLCSQLCIPKLKERCRVTTHHNGLPTLQLLEALQGYLTGSMAQQAGLLNVCGRRLYEMLVYTTILTGTDSTVREHRVKAIIARPPEFPRNLMPILREYYTLNRRRVW